MGDRTEANLPEDPNDFFCLKIFLLWNNETNNKTMDRKNKNNIFKCKVLHF